MPIDWTQVIGHLANPVAFIVALCITLWRLEDVVKDLVRRVRRAEGPGFKLEADEQSLTNAPPAVINQIEETRDHVEKGILKSKSPEENDISSASDRSDLINAEIAISGVLHHPLHFEQENFIRNELREKVPNIEDRENILIKFLAYNQFCWEFEYTYRLIFGSQLALLRHLNQRYDAIAKLDEIRGFYFAANERGLNLESVSFEDWLSFLQSRSLILRPDSDTIGITIRGKEFLKFLIDRNYSFEKLG